MTSQALNSDLIFWQLNNFAVHLGYYGGYHGVNQSQSAHNRNKKTMQRQQLNYVLRYKHSINDHRAGVDRMEFEPAETDSSNLAVSVSLLAKFWLHCTILLFANPQRRWKKRFSYIYLNFSVDGERFKTLVLTQVIFDLFRFICSSVDMSYPNHPRFTGKWELIILVCSLLRWPMFCVCLYVCVWLYWSTAVGRLSLFWPLL